MKYDRLTTAAPEPGIIGQPGVEYWFEFYAPDDDGPSGLCPSRAHGFWSADCDWQAAVRSMWRFRRSLKGIPTPAVPPDRFVLFPPNPMPARKSG